MKKVWKKPQINIFVRGAAEESILTGCKGNPDAGDTGPSGDRCATYYDVDPIDHCVSVQIS